MSRFFFTSFLSILSSSAWASNLQPEVGAASCFTREYTATHMATHPTQTLDAISVYVQNHPADPKVSTDSYSTARVIGRRSGVLYANTAWCTYKADGSVACAIDCDGGAFSLKLKGKGAAFVVAKDYYFPLVTNDYDDGEQSGSPTSSGEMLSLEYRKKEDRVFHLNHTSNVTCEKLWERYQRLPSFGC